jgi:hypothetical protein
MTARALSQVRPVPRRGLSRDEAAMYIGVSAGKFDADGRMPGPVKIDSRKVWDVRSLDLAFDALPRENHSAPNSWDGRLSSAMTRIKLKYVNEYIDRHGKVRRYFRRPGSRAIPLPGLPGSIEFIAAYQGRSRDCHASGHLPRNARASGRARRGAPPSSSPRRPRRGQPCRPRVGP